MRQMAMGDKPPQGVTAQEMKHGETGERSDQGAADRHFFYPPYSRPSKIGGARSETMAGLPATPVRLRCPGQLGQKQACYSGGNPKIALEMA